MAYFTAPPQTPLGELTALPSTPDPLAGFRGLLLREWRGGEEKRGGEGRGKAPH